LLVRQHGEVDRNRNPQIARSEFKLLQVLQAEDLPVPTPYHVDESCEIFPIPVLIVEYIEGHTEFSPVNTEDCMQQLVTNLVRIHRVNLASGNLAFLPQYEIVYAEKMSRKSRTVNDGFNTPEIQQALATIASHVQMNNAVLLHGDYWLGNILWRDGLLVGIIDWEDAMLGEPLVDLAKSRFETLWLFGMDGMNLFTETYQALMPHLDYRFLPYWDLRLSVRKCPDIEKWIIDDEAKKQAMQEQCRQFMAQSLENLNKLSL
jgi:aminoglycoside phosphotransferase (APT) family kinase protein